MERAKRKEGLEKTKQLSDQQFRFLFVALCNQCTRDTMRMTPNLFSRFISEEQNNYIITEDILEILGGIEEIEAVCDLFNATIFDTQKIRQTLEIEPFVASVTNEDVL